MQTGNRLHDEVLEISFNDFKSETTDNIVCLVPTCIVSRGGDEFATVPCERKNDALKPAIISFCLNLSVFPVMSNYHFAY